MSRIVLVALAVVAVVVAEELDLNAASPIQTFQRNSPALMGVADGLAQRAWKLGGMAGTEARERLGPDAAAALYDMRQILTNTFGNLTDSFRQLPKEVQDELTGAFTFFQWLSNNWNEITPTLNIASRLMRTGFIANLAPKPEGY